MVFLHVGQKCAPNPVFLSLVLASVSFYFSTCTPPPPLLFLPTIKPTTCNCTPTLLFHSFSAPVKACVSSPITHPAVCIQPDSSLDQTTGERSQSPPMDRSEWSPAETTGRQHEGEAEYKPSGFKSKNGNIKL